MWYNYMLRWLAPRCVDITVAIVSRNRLAASRHKPDVILRNLASPAGQNDICLTWKYFGKLEGSELWRYVVVLPEMRFRIVILQRQTPNIRRTLEGNEIVDHSDVFGASPVGAAPTIS